VDDGIAIEFIHGGHDAVLKFLFGRDADVAQLAREGRMLGGLGRQVRGVVAIA
jgi:hypothetical protein